jgi:hypothetical protein
MYHLLCKQNMCLFFANKKVALRPESDFHLTIILLIFNKLIWSDKQLTVYRDMCESARLIHFKSLH